MFAKQSCDWGQAHAAAAKPTPAAAAAPTGRQRLHTVMFTDIEGFTRLVEALPPTMVARLLRSHFRMLARCIEVHGGRIDKVMGDGLSAVWPHRVDHAASCAPALRAAMAIRAALTKDNERRRRRGRPPVRLRIGIHAGPLYATALGSAGRLGVLLCGDTINLAQRLEQAARCVSLGDAVAIVASDAVAARAGTGFPLEELGCLAVRGRGQPVAAFAVGRWPEDDATSGCG